ncbi:MAG: hypothetical protein JO184_02495 [Gammaproteobacteria bacterium]|nr:hypothetical protein [Gammaproteobacteria bacterium]MBV8307779.1 hypothetical protein [Gammaproteobacteria bacterium]
MSIRTPYLAAIALLTGSVAVISASAGNLSFLNQSPLNYFNADDMEMMRQNARKVLDDPAANARQTWSNAKTGASGLAQVRSEFKTSDGVPCKRLRIINKAKGLQGDATYTICKSPDGDWAIHTDAAPAP